MAVAVTKIDGSQTTTVELPQAVFGIEPNESVVHSYIVRYLANQRQGNSSTKTRSDVSGGGAKPWRQKGTGRARAGTIRSPLWPGGGTAFGPLPRDYRMAIPRKMRHLALRSAFSARALEQAVHVVEPLVFEAPKTKLVTALLERMDLAGKKVLILTDGDNRNVILSARNIPDVEVRRYRDANPYEVLRADTVVIEEPALGTLVQGADLGDSPVRREKSPAQAPADSGEADQAPKKKSAAKKAKTAPAKKAAAKAPAKKPAARAAKGATAKKAKKPSRKKG